MHGLGPPCAQSYASMNVIACSNTRSSSQSTSVIPLNLTVISRRMDYIWATWSRTKEFINLNQLLG